MKCERVDEMLADYLGDELSSADRSSVDTHVAECTRCADEVGSLQAAVTALDVLDAGTFERPAHILPTRRSFRRQGFAYAATLMIGCYMGWAMKPTETENDVGPGVKGGVEIPSAGSLDGTSFANAKPPPDRFRRNAYRLIKAFSGGR